MMMQIISKRSVIGFSQPKQNEIHPFRKSKFDFKSSFLSADHSSPHQFDLFVEFAKKEPP